MKPPWNCRLSDTGLSNPWDCKDMGFRICGSWPLLHQDCVTHATVTSELSKPVEKLQELNTCESSHFSEYWMKFHKLPSFLCTFLQNETLWGIVGTLNQRQMPFAFIVLDTSITRWQLTEELKLWHKLFYHNLRAFLMMSRPQNLFWPWDILPCKSLLFLL